MSIDPNSAVPVYQQIVEHVRRSIAAGVYRPGEMIPSIRAMALDLTVNPNTVQRAYEALERERLIKARKGLGMFVTDRAARSAKAQSEAGVRRRFKEGIRAGRDAELSPDLIRDTFEKAWDDIDTAVRRNP